MHLQLVLLLIEELATRLSTNVECRVVVVHVHPRSNVSFAITTLIQSRHQVRIIKTVFHALTSTTHLGKVSHSFSHPLIVQS